MRRSEFHRAVNDEFGAQAVTLLNDLALNAFGGRTAGQALEDGESPREIWRVLCAEMDVPENRSYGVGRREPRKR